MSANPNNNRMPATFDIQAFKQSIAIENLMRKENRGSSNVFSTNALLQKNNVDSNDMELIEFMKGDNNSQTPVVP
jgi:hypothetical protein